MPGKKVLILDFDCTLTKEHSGGFGFIKEDQNKFFAVDANNKRQISMLDPKLLHIVLSAAKNKGWDIRIATNHGASGRLISQVGSKIVMHNNGGLPSNGGAPGVQFLLDEHLPADRTYLNDPSHIIAHMAINVVDNKRTQDRANGKKTHFAVIKQELDLTNDVDDQFIFVDDESSNLDSIADCPNMVTIIAPKQLPSCHDECSHFIQIAVQIGMTLEELRTELDKADIESRIKDGYVEIMRKALLQKAQRASQSRATTPWLIRAESADGISTMAQTSSSSTTSTSTTLTPPPFSFGPVSKPNVHITPIYMDLRKENPASARALALALEEVPEPVTPPAFALGSTFATPTQLTPTFSAKKRSSDGVEKTEVDDSVASSSITSSQQLDADIKKLRLSSE